MRVDIYQAVGKHHRELLGTVRLKDGRAVFDDGAARMFPPDRFYVPGGLTPADGEAYLAAFVRAVSGTYVWAELVES
jgi:hypothetical protein